MKRDNENLTVLGKKIQYEMDYNPKILERFQINILIMIIL